MEAGELSDVLDRLLELWARPPAEGDEGLRAFRDVYADPVRLNGVDVPVQELVERARLLHAAFELLGFQVLYRVDAPGQIGVAHLQRARHVGPLPTPLGVIPPTGRVVEVRAIDLLTIVEGRVSALWVVSDELGRLLQLGAVALPELPASPSGAEPAV